MTDDEENIMGGTLESSRAITSEEPADQLKKALLSVWIMRKGV